MKPLITVTAVAALVSISAYAQNSSGSGNGSGNRDVLDFKQDLDRSKLNLTSIEEDMAHLNAKLDELKRQAAQPPSDASGFWNELTQTGRQVAIDYTTYLQSVIAQSVAATQNAQSIIQQRIDSLEAIRSDRYQFQNRDLERDFEKRIRNTRKSMKEDGKELISAIIEPLFLPFNGAEEYFKQCDTAICADLLYQKSMEYHAFVADISKKEVEIAGYKYSVKNWNKRKHPQTFNRLWGDVWIETFSDNTGKKLISGSRNFRNFHADSLFSRGKK